MRSVQRGRLLGLQSQRIVGRGHLAMDRGNQGKSLPIVADGRQRALAGASEQLASRRAAVEAATGLKYAARMQQAGIIGRLWLRLRMRWEVRRQMSREIEKIAPSGGLYSVSDKGRGDSRCRRKPSPVSDRPVDF